MANSNDRSSHIPFDRNAKTGEFKRSAHNDFATAAELKQREFTGVRDNSITGRLEFWILGNIEKEVTPTAATLNPAWQQEVFQELFALR